MNRLALCALTAASLSSVAFSDPLLSFGPNVPLFITASASVRRDSNIFLTEKNALSDTVYLLDPGLSFTSTGSKGSFSASFNESFDRYATYRQLNDHLANLAANLTYQGSKSSYAASALYEEQDQSNLTAQNVSQTVKHTLSQFSGSTEVAAGSQTSIGVGATSSKTSYPTSLNLINNTLTAIPVDLYYATSAKTSVSADYEYDHNVPDKGTDGFKTQFLGIGARGDFTPKLSGQIRVGQTKYKSDAGQDDSNLGLTASLTYLFSPKTTFSLSGSSGFSAAPTGPGQKVRAFGITGSTTINDTWSLSYGGSYSTTDYLDSTERHDRFVVGNVALNYTLNQSTAFQLNYTDRKNTSTALGTGALVPTDDGASFDDRVLSIAASTKF